MQLLPLTKSLSTVSIIAMSAMAAIPTITQAQQISLISEEDGIKIDGTLLALDGDVYVVRTELGDLRVSINQVRCEGAACPADPSGAQEVAFRGSSTIGAGLMPVLLAGFADQLDGDTRIVDTTSGQEILGTVVADQGFGDEIGTYLVHSSASVDAFTALVHKSASIGMSSRRILPAEAKALRDAGAGNMISPSQEHIIALDSLVVVVHPDNPIRALTIEQIKGIFSGTITNWSVVGGPDAPIKVVDREGWSSKRQAFSEAIFGPSVALPGLRNAVVAEDGAEAANLVQGDVHAIGYLSHAQKRGAIPLSLVSECGLPMIPDAFSARTEEYGLLQRLYFYNRADSLDQNAQALLDYALSERADPLIQKAGFFDLSVEARSQSSDSPRAQILRNTSAGPYESGFIQDMLDDMASHDRLSTTFRFRTGSSKLDERGRIDMARLTSYLQAMPAGTQIVFAGFTDDVGAFDANRTLSMRRAEAALAEFAAFSEGQLDGIEMKAKGYGEIAPSQCNTSEQGRGINRRVEVWLTTADTVSSQDQ